jgi:adenine-specific DNA-methyltransferase
MQKLKLHTPDLTAANIDRIAALFPNCITETKDESGKAKRAIDFDLLRQELSESLVEGPQERYRLDWPGKREALALANQPITKTLRPCREESVDFENTKNLYIEGDNLDALKLLQETYLGKVKMIYIDPPYNTGNDFIYDDNFSMNRSEYEELSGDRDEEGNAMFDAEKWKQNSSANGRFHSEWLSMMYPRLKLARNLLREDGVILVSMNESEIAGLKSILLEIYGQDNRIECFIWNNEGNIDQQSKIKGVHEYIVAFIRNSEQLQHPEVIDPNIEESSKLYNERIENSITKNGPANPPSCVYLPVGFPASFNDGVIEERDDKWPHIIRKLVVKDGCLVEPGKVYSGWSSRNLLDLFISNGCSPINDSTGKKTWFEITQTGAIYGLKDRSDTQGHVLSVIRNVGTTKQNGNTLKSWGIPFSYPKPTLLLHYLLRVFNSKSSDIILDFFSGSATTAHAVMQLNAEDGGRRRHIMVQLPEPCDEKSEAFKAGYKTIAEIGKERIRRAGQKILQEWQEKQAKEQSAERDLLHPTSNLQNSTSPPDIGFRVLKIADSNFREIERTPEELEQLDLLKHTEHIKPDRTPEDLLFQVLVDWGVDLALPIVSETLHGKRVFFVDENALAACFDTGLSDELVHAIATRKPLRAVFRDDGFGDDSTRINVEQIFKLLSPGTEVKAL